MSAPQVCCVRTCLHCSSWQVNTKHTPRSLWYGTTHPASDVPWRVRACRLAGEAQPLGSLADLRACTKGGFDPEKCSAKNLAPDVLWSDPVMVAGLTENVTRGLGLIYGPDVSEQFLRQEGLRLLVRSHEGPDARADRTDGMQPMDDGFTLDHNTPAGAPCAAARIPAAPCTSVTCSGHVLVAGAARWTVLARAAASCWQYHCSAATAAPPAQQHELHATWCYSAAPHSPSR